MNDCINCNGTRGGVPGNSQWVNGMLLCDYCHADLIIDKEIRLPNGLAKDELALRGALSYLEHAREHLFEHESNYCPTECSSCDAVDIIINIEWNVHSELVDEYF